MLFCCFCGCYAWTLYWTAFSARREAALDFELVIKGMLAIVSQDVWLLFIVIVFSFRLIVFSVDLEYLLGACWPSKENEPSAGHVTFVVSEGSCTSGLWEHELGNKVGGFVKPLKTNKSLEDSTISEAELPVNHNAVSTLVWFWFCVYCPPTGFLRGSICVPAWRGGKNRAHNLYYVACVLSSVLLPAPYYLVSLHKGAISFRHSRYSNKLQSEHSQTYSGIQHKLGGIRQSLCLSS